MDVGEEPRGRREAEGERGRDGWTRLNPPPIRKLPVLTGPDYDLSVVADWLAWRDEKNAQLGGVAEPS